MRPLEYRARPYSEVQLARIAAIESALASRDPFLTLTSRADNAVRPEPRFEVNPCCFGIGEHLEELEGADRALAHERIVLNSLEGVKYYLKVLCLMFSMT